MSTTSRIRFTLPPLPTRPAYLLYFDEPACTRSHLSSPSQSFDSTLPTVHEDSVLESTHSIDRFDGIEDEEDEEYNEILSFHSNISSNRRTLMDTKNIQSNEVNEKKKTIVVRKEK